MSPALKAKLLRGPRKAGSARSARTRRFTRAPLLAATNRNLEEAVQRGQFREDLFYRLNVVELNIPPLRERREDILPLASLFIAQFTQGRARFSATVGEILARYPWPGNVRELRNVMERAALLCRGEMCTRTPAHPRAGAASAVGPWKPVTGNVGRGGAPRRFFRPCA